MADSMDLVQRLLAWQEISWQIWRFNRALRTRGEQVSIKLFDGHCLLLVKTMSRAPLSSLTRVYLVGSGPGDPGMITLQAVQCLAKADVVLYDYLVNPQVLDYAPQEAEKVCLGRHGHSRIWTQDEINQRIVELATSGKTVVRLKGGDPAVFAHAADESEVLAREGIPFQVVPGITAAMAAGSCVGVPLTHRHLASAVAFVTGCETPEKEDSLLDYDGLARFPGTLVFYMGVTTVAEWSSSLVAAGKPAETPAVIVRRVSCPDQLVIRCSLGEVAGKLSVEQKIRPPVIVIVGQVAGLEENLAWFQQRPLFGKTVLVTRALSQSRELVEQCAERGARVLVQPVIEIMPLQEMGELDAMLGQLDQFDWLVFSSRNGVHHFLDRLFHSGQDLRALGGLKLAAIGPGTRQALLDHHLQADLQPATYRAEALAESLQPEAAAGKRFLLARANRGREVLAEMLRDAGGEVQQVVVYRSTDVTEVDPAIEQELEAGGVDWITVTSSAIARSLVSLLGEKLSNAKLVSISPLTSATLEELGHSRAAEAEIYTIPGLVEAMSD